MGLNDWRTAFTVVNFAVFIGIVVWAWSGKRKQRFEEAALLAVEDETADSDDKTLPRN